MSHWKINPDVSIIQIKHSKENLVILGQNERSIYKRQSKFVIPDLELVTVFEQEGDLISSAQEISSSKVLERKKMS